MRNYNIRFVEAFRFCLAAERLIRGGTRQGDALFPRASPLQKSPTGAFLNSPLAEGLLTLEVSRSAERDRGAESRLPARSALLSLRLRGVHRTPAPPGPRRL